MEKILLAIDAVKPDENALNFAIYLAKLSGSKITGVFLENLVAEEKLVLKRMHGMDFVDWDVNERSEDYKAKLEIINFSISIFKEACNRSGVSYNIHLDEGVPVRELISESRFADVIVIDAETSFRKQYSGAPSGFVRDFLKKAECPVIISPESFDTISEIIFTYDNSASSVFAIKQFTYLFPQFRDKRITILQVAQPGGWTNSEKNKFREWLNNHYSDLHFETLIGEANERLFDYFFKRKNVFITMGAYGRNTLSRILRHSHADLLIRTGTQPLFIAHT